MGSKGADGRVNRQQFNAMVAQYGEVGMGALFGESLEWSGGAHCNLPSLKFYGGSVQSGTPAPEAPVNMYDHIGVYKVNSLQDYIRLPNLRGAGAKYTSLGNIRDEWDYVTGKGTRRIKKIVADGETIKVDYASSKSGRITLTEPGLSGNGGATAVLCTHFNTAWNTNPGSIYILNTNIVVMSMSGGLSVGDWNTWLKAQKEAGTPVIIYYALKEPIPFEERPQPYVPIPNDSGEISFVDGNVSGIPFEVIYIIHS